MLILRNFSVSFSVFCYRTPSIFDFYFSGLNFCVFLNNLEFCIRCFGVTISHRYTVLISFKCCMFEVFEIIWVLVYFQLKHNPVSIAQYAFFWGCFFLNCANCQYSLMFMYRHFRWPITHPECRELSEDTRSDSLSLHQNTYTTLIEDNNKKGLEVLMLMISIRSWEMPWILRWPVYFKYFYGRCTRRNFLPWNMMDCTVAKGVTRGSRRDGVVILIAIFGSFSS